MDNQNEMNNPMQGAPYNYGGYNQQGNLFSIIDSLSGWMKFMGVYSIIAGAISCLGIITAAIGIPMIFAGLGLNRASESLKQYKANNNQYILNEVFTNMNKYFKIQGILIIIGLVVSVISIIIATVIAIAAVNTFTYY